MITNQFVYFKNKEDFLNSNVSETSIVFIESTREIWTHNNFYSCSVEEAPRDNLPYYRINGTWEQSNPEELKYASITFVDTDGSPTIKKLGDDSWIKGKRCLAKKSGETLAICYLDENNSELFHDGVTKAPLDGTLGYWMTDIPEYWYTMDETTEGSHILTIVNTERPGYRKSRRVFLGVTEGVVANGKLCSRKTGNEESTGNLTSIQCHNYAIANGKGFNIIDYESHCKIAHLFYAKYGTRDPLTLSIFSEAINIYTNYVGSTSTLGNNDGGSDTLLSFLGVENFFGGKAEWVGGIHGHNSTYYIYEGYQPDLIPTVNYRIVDVGDIPTLEGALSPRGFISKMHWGSYADVIPTELEGTSTTHYCDFGLVNTEGWTVVRRSEYSQEGSTATVQYGGVAYFHAYDTTESTDDFICSRLLYRGDVIVIEDPNEFLALPTGL